MEKYRNFGQLNFLIADDNAFMRTTIRHILEAFGAQHIQEAPDGAEALKITENWVPDIVLMEWELRPLNGVEIAKMLRHSPSPARRFIPIIILSAYSEQWRIAEARDAGVTEYLVKPVSANTVMSHIVTSVERPRPFIKAPGFFGPDRRRHQRVVEFERRVRVPDVTPYPGVLSQSFLPNISLAR